jgi:hypothetical protein
MNDEDYYENENENENENEEVDEVFDNNEFVFTKKDGHYVGGGYKLNSLFLQKSISPMTTLNGENKLGGGTENVSYPFEHLAVPAGLFYINQRSLNPKEGVVEHMYSKHEVLSDDIFDKLFGLVEVDKKKRRKTRKHTNKSGLKKTRRHK